MARSGCRRGSKSSPPPPERRCVGSAGLFHDRSQHGRVSRAGARISAPIRGSRRMCPASRLFEHRLVVVTNRRRSRRSSGSAGASEPVVHSRGTQDCGRTGRGTKPLSTKICPKAGLTDNRRSHGFPKASNFGKPSRSAQTLTWRVGRIVWWGRNGRDWLGHRTSLRYRVGGRCQ